MTVGFGMLNMSIEKLPGEEIAYRKTWFGYSEDKNWWDKLTHWRIKCDVCGNEKVFSIKSYSYNGWGRSGWEFWCSRDLGFEKVEYGELNKRIIHVCKTHRDAEIEETINHLI
jgi:hypothetical protein